VSISIGLIEMRACVEKKIMKFEGGEVLKVLLTI